MQDDNINFASEPLSDDSVDGVHLDKQQEEKLVKEINKWKDLEDYIETGEVEIDEERAEVAKCIISQIESGTHIQLLSIPGADPLNLEKKPQKKDSKTYFQENSLEKTKKGEVTLKDMSMLKIQLDITSKIVKQLGKNLITRNFRNLSLPITIFEPRTYLQHYAQSLSFAPDIIKEAMKMPRLEDRLLKCGNIITSSFNFSILWRQPLNPILGETLTGYLGDVELYGEQISHHPPIGYFYMKGPGFKMYGNFETKILIRIPKVKVAIVGTITLEFEDIGKKIKFYYPPVYIGGVLSGSRNFSVEGRCHAWCEEEKIIAEMFFAPSGKRFYQIWKSQSFKDKVEGGLYKVPEKIMTEFAKNPRKSKNMQDYGPNAFKIVGIEGKWTSVMNFGYYSWDVDKNTGWTLKESTKMLPSDSNFRLDLLNMKLGKFREASEFKSKMEEDQRRDKKLRIEAEKTRKNENSN